jgi:hypothetical protein
VLARPIVERLRRHPDDSSVAGLLTDINLAADAAVTSTLVAGAGYKVKTPDGEWRGRCLRHFDAAGEALVVAFRTWLAED